MKLSSETARAPFWTKRGRHLTFPAPTFHESKAEFVRERDAVQKIIDSCSATIDSLFGAEYRDDLVQKAMIGRLQVAIDGHAKQKIAPKFPETADDLVRKNLIETGFFFNSVLMIFDMKSCYEQRLKELKDQEERYWNVSHRPPNYYARTIALRFARHYARLKCFKPTFGTSRDGGHPSTDFGRALEKVFEILEIKASVRNAATWAIDQLTEEDWSPPKNALAGGLFGLLGGIPPEKPKGRNALAEISAALEKGK